MRTLRRLVTSIGASVALGLAMAGVTLAADPLEVDTSAVVEGDGQAELEIDPFDEGADAAADVGANATADADVDLDTDAVLDTDAAADVDAHVAADAAARLNAWAEDRHVVDAEAVIEHEADVAADVAGDAELADADATGFQALDVCVRLALLDKAGSCMDDASGGQGGGDAVLYGTADLQADAALDAVSSVTDGWLGPDDADLAADTAADACLRFALFGNAGSCAGDPAPGGGASDVDAGAVEAVARLTTAADAAASTDEGTAATAALDACASFALFADTATCGFASAPDDGDTAPDDGTAPDTDYPGTSPDGGTAPATITRPDAAAGDGSAGSLPDTASGLIGDPFVPSAILVMLLAGSAVLRRMRGASD